MYSYNYHLPACAGDTHPLLLHGWHLSWFPDLDTSQGHPSAYRSKVCIYIYMPSAYNTGAVQGKLTGSSSMRGTNCIRLMRGSVTWQNSPDTSHAPTGTTNVDQVYQGALLTSLPKYTLTMGKFQRSLHAADSTQLP